MYKLYFTKQSQKDAPKVKEAGLKEKAQKLLEILQNAPFQNPLTPAPPRRRFKKLVGDLSGLYSRRINIQHRLVYQVYKKQKAVKVLSMWSHYE